MITFKIIQVQRASCLGQHDNFLDGDKITWRDNGIEGGFCNIQNNSRQADFVEVGFYLA